MQQPLVSVIMPSYNTKKEYLFEAIHSVLEQTYTNFELLIIDDGSIPPVVNVIKDIKDERIFVISNPRNQGLPRTLNNGLNKSIGKYIFRMDSDDKCTKERFARQVEFFEKNPEIDVVSSFAQTFGSVKRLYKSFTSDEEIKAELLWKNPIIHPSVAIRADTIKKFNICYAKEATSEDFEMWSRLAFKYHCKFAVIPEVLLQYRIHSGQITVIRQEKLRHDFEKILKRSFTELGITLSEDEFEAYCEIQRGKSISKLKIYYAISAMKKILAHKAIDISALSLKKIYTKILIKYSVKNKNILSLIEAIKIYF